MNQSRIFIAIMLFAFLLTSCAGSDAGEESKIKITSHYIGYACGECAAKYQIKKVIGTSKDVKENLVNRDIKLIFSSKELENKIDSIVEKCAICYDYTLDGYLIYQPEKDYSIVKVDSCTVQLINPECCK